MFLRVKHVYIYIYTVVEKIQMQSIYAIVVSWMYSNTNHPSVFNSQKVFYMIHKQQKNYMKKHKNAPLSIKKTCYNVKCTNEYRFTSSVWLYQENDAKKTFHAYETRIYILRFHFQFKFKFKFKNSLLLPIYSFGHTYIFFSEVQHHTYIIHNYQATAISGSPIEVNGASWSIQGNPTGTIMDIYTGIKG